MISVGFYLYVEVHSLRMAYKRWNVLEYTEGFVNGSHLCTSLGIPHILLSSSVALEPTMSLNFLYNPLLWLFIPGNDPPSLDHLLSQIFHYTTHPPKFRSPPLCLFLPSLEGIRRVWVFYYCSFFVYALSIRTLLL